MTTDNTNKPDFYLFANIDGENKRVGAAFKHRKGNGFNFIVNGQRFAAFPPKAKPATGKGKGKGA